MLLGSRATLQSVTRRALTALVACVCLLMPVASVAARQAADWAGGGETCGMACCKRTGHCCCRMPKPAAPLGPALATPQCPAGCAASVQPGQFGSGLFRPVEPPFAIYVFAASLLPIREAGNHTSTWQVPSLWQRPPPFSPFSPF